MKKSIFALAMGTFTLGMAEFQMMGILTALSSEIGVSVATAGHLISAYAAGVCVGAPALLWMRKMALKKVLLILVALMFAGNLIATFAPGFHTLMIGRFIAGLPHGAFFGVGAIVARRLATPGREVMDVSLMIAGMTVATLIGVPLGTFLSTRLTWRMAFGLVTLSACLTYLAVRVNVPDVGALKPTGFKAQFHFLRTAPPWLIFGGVIFCQIGLYCWYSYIDPLMLHVAGFTPTSLTWLMVVAGAGMFCGNLVSGRLCVRYKPSYISAWVMFIAMLVLGTVYLFADVRWLMPVLLFLGTACLFGSSSPMQSSIVEYSKGGEMLGGACIQIAYNAGNAIAAAIGSAIIAGGGGYRLPSLVGIPIVAAGLVLVLILYRRYERN